jgi:hypothetical protein
MVKITNDWEKFLDLEKPTDKFDEPSFGGFNYWISSVADGFNANDLYLNLGDESTEDSTVAADLGDVSTLSGVAFNFSIKQVVDTRYVFSVTNTSNNQTDTVCWGTACPEGSISKATLSGETGFNGYNGLQIQLRAQDVDASSASLSNMQLIGMRATEESAPLLSSTVEPDTESTLPLDPSGRLGQWILGTGLPTRDWELTGTITLTRPDEALIDRNKVRLAVDFIKDTTL